MLCNFIYTNLFYVRIMGNLKYHLNTACNMTKSNRHLCNLDIYVIYTTALVHDYNVCTQYTTILLYILYKSIKLTFPFSLVYTAVPCLACYVRSTGGRPYIYHDKFYCQHFQRALLYLHLASRRHSYRAFIWTVCVCVCVWLTYFMGH